MHRIDHVLQEERFLRGGVLVHEVDVALEVDQDETLAEVPHYVADGKHLLVEH